jgi:hypothetical protein
MVVAVVAMSVVGGGSVTAMVEEAATAAAQRGLRKRWTRQTRRTMGPLMLDTPSLMMKFGEGGYYDVFGCGHYDVRSDHK